MPSFKASAIGPSNIALSKYWGRSNEELTLPLNDSISMTLDGANTHTTVEFSKKYQENEVWLGAPNQPMALVGGSQGNRVISHLNFLKHKSGVKYNFKVVSENNFPMDAGIASSASAFSALTLAAIRALGLKANKKEQSILTRLAGSGSATRSVYGGIVRWRFANNSQGSYAEQLYPAGYWSLVDLILVVSDKPKKHSSLSGHRLTKTSPFMEGRLKKIKQINKQMEQALASKDIDLLGEAIEHEMFSLHAVAMTSSPPILYWGKGTIMILQEVVKLREKGIPVYATIDAGPNVHLIAEAKNLNKLSKHFKTGFFVKNMYKCSIGQGARITKKHLF